MKFDEILNFVVMWMDTSIVHLRCVVFFTIELMEENQWNLLTFVYTVQCCRIISTLAVTFKDENAIHLFCLSCLAWKHPFTDNFCTTMCCWQFSEIGEKVSKSRSKSQQSSKSQDTKFFQGFTEDQIWGFLMCEHIQDRICFIFYFFLTSEVWLWRTRYCYRPLLSAFNKQ